MSFGQLLTLGQIKNLGINDERWTIQDKLQMYKGLIKIYNREQKNQIKDTNGLKKKNFRKIAKLQKEVHDMQVSYSLSIQGDKRVIRTAMQDHRDIQLAYMNSHPDKTIEDVKHRNFCRSKQLNLIRYEKQKGEKRLLDSQVALGELLDLINSPDFGRMDLAQQQMSNQIQNYVVKYCAAQNIRNAYKRMLAVLYKDQRYYDAILRTLQFDGSVQHNCLIRATEMGQLATEEISNMRQEYALMEKKVRASMMERERCLKEVRDRLVVVYDASQGLCRTESAVDFAFLKDEVKPKVKGLAEEVRHLDDVLIKLQAVMLVPSFDDIFPRMLETMRQNKRLLEQLESNSNACDDLLNKRNHSELLFYQLHHSGNNAARLFKTERDELKANILAQEERAQRIKIEQDVLSTESVKIRQGLNRMCQMLEEVQFPPDYEDTVVPPWPVKDVAERIRPLSPEEENQLCPITEQGQRLLYLLESKLNFVKLNLKEKGQPDEQDRAFATHFEYVNEFLATNMYPPEAVEDEAASLVIDIVIEDSQVPNRLEVKLRSQELYEEATRNPYEVQDTKKPKKKK